MRVVDNYDLFEQHEMERESRLAKLPKCSWCGEPITEEHCHKIDGRLVCENCIEDTKVSVDDFITE